MQHWVFTALILCAAVFCYFVGAIHLGTGFIVAGVALELWFWWRLLRSPKKSVNR